MVRKKGQESRIGNKRNRKSLKIYHEILASSDDEEEWVGDNPHKFEV